MSQAALSIRRTGALYLSAWLMLGILFAGLAASSSDAGWSHALLIAVPVTMVYGCAAGFSTYYLCRAYPLADKRPGAIVLVFAFAAAIGGGLWTLMCVAWNSLWPGAGIVLTGAIRNAIFGLGVILYCLLAVGQYLAVEFQRARQAEKRQLESQLAAQEAELRMLRTQIDPHFLFNSLNSISALTSQNPQRARDMTLQLAEFFRHTLGLEAHRKVTVEAEMKLLTHFLSIEKVRFGARLNVAFDVADGAADCLLPPMLVQPLVENAVKHGIGNLAEGGTVRISVTRAGSVLHIVVENDVDSETPAQPGKGIGLANVRQRLAALYRHEASVHWSREENTFRVVLSLPAETMEQPCVS